MYRQFQTTLSGLQPNNIRINAENLFWKKFYKFFKFSNKRLPHNRFGDKISAYLGFISFQRRIPSRTRPLFNDVLYTIKTSDEIIDPLRVFVSDKEYVKLYVAAVAGEQYNIPNFAVLHTPSAVDEYDFPPRCCIKPTQCSGPIILRRDGEDIDRSLIKSWFDIDYYRLWREANYRPLKPKVIVEQLAFDDPNAFDYKFFCFNGAAKLIQVDIDRYIDHRRGFYTPQWERQPFSLKQRIAEDFVPRPENLDEMIAIAEKLSARFGFVRIDLYSNGKDCLVGEITNCHGSAIQVFIPRSAEALASEIIFGPPSNEL